MDGWVGTPRRSGIKTQACAERRLAGVGVGGRTCAAITDAAAVVFGARIQHNRDLVLAPVRTFPAVISAAIPVFPRVTLNVFIDTGSVRRRIRRHRINIARDDGSLVVGFEILDAGIFWNVLDPLHVLKYSVFACFRVYLLQTAF